jgi:ribulose-bisphosphate carboxylase small chain
MRLETFSYLPALTAEQLKMQVRAILDRGLVVGIEYTTAPDPRDHYWTMWKLPLFGRSDPAAVLAELDACRQANPGAFIKVNGYDRTRQGQVVSFVASRPAGDD